MFCFASGGGAAWGGGAAGGGNPPPGPCGFGGCTPDIIIVPLNFEAATLGLAALSSVPHAAHADASSVFGFPQFGQKTVTGIPPPSRVSGHATPPRHVRASTSGAETPPPRTNGPQRSGEAISWEGRFRPQRKTPRRWGSSRLAASGSRPSGPGFSTLVRPPCALPRSRLTSDGAQPSVPPPAPLHARNTL